MGIRADIRSGLLLNQPAVETWNLLPPDHQLFLKDPFTPGALEGRGSLNGSFKTTPGAVKRPPPLPQNLAHLSG